MSHHPGDSRPPFRFVLLGRPAVLDASGSQVPGLGPGKPLALLAYLAVTGPTSREKAAALLWGDVSESRARNAFRQTLHRLRAALGEDTLPQRAGSLELASDRIITDVTEFETAIGAGRPGEAIPLYQGEFLLGLNVDAPAFAQWAEEQRQRFAARYRTAATRVAEEALEAGDAPRAAELAHSLTEAAPLDGEAAVLEATALVAAGRRAEAIAALTMHARRVQAELGRSPDGTVAKMLARLLRAGDPERGSANQGPLAPESERVPFVGRERELATLAATWRRVQRGHGETIVLAGPEGIGKSRLIDEFAGRTRTLAPVTVLRGRESSNASGLAYGSIAEALRDVAAAPGAAAASQHLLAEAARLLPQLRDRFQLPEPGPITEEAERVRFYEGLAALLDALAYERPVLLIVEDIHEAPEATLSLLRYLSNRLRGVAALIVLTTRSAAGARVIGELLALEPLGEKDTLELLNHALGGEHPTADERRRLAALSGGVPYRLLDLAERAVAAEVPTAAPVRLRDVMLRRLQRCTPYQQRVFVASALFGGPVSIRLLAAAAHLSEPAALDAVLELERKGLVEQRHDGVEPANATVAELALEGTGAAGVALLAGWAADALAREHGARAAELVRLYLVAGRREEIHAHALRAAWDAALVGASEQAEEYARLAIGSATSNAGRERAEEVLRMVGGGAPRLTAGSGGSAPQPREEPYAAPASDAPVRDRRWRVRPQIAAVGAAVLLLAAAVRFGLAERAPGPGAMLSDTLVVAERTAAGEVRYYDVYGTLFPFPALARQRTVRPGLDWVERLTAPWTNPLVSTGQDRVAVEYITRTGSDLFIISADRRDTTRVAGGGRDAIGAGWSPDGAWLLAIHGSTDPAGEYHTELIAHAAADPARTIPFDAGPASAVVDAAWSPRGDRVAWTARTGAERQQEVFLSYADGSGRTNVSNHPAEDFQIAWAPDGERLAFISERDGGPELYTYELATAELRRMTFDLAPKAQPAFSPDGRFLAYESTRGGIASVYLMPSWAGVPRPVAGGERRLSLVGWRGESPRFADRVRIRAPASIAPGRSTRVIAEVSDRAGGELQGAEVHWSTLDTSVVAIHSSAPATASAGSGMVEIRGRNAGVAPIVADFGGWRADTVLVQVAPSASVLQASFAGGTTRGWRLLAMPTEQRANGTRDSDGLALTGTGRTGTSMLSETTLPVTAGTTLRARIRAPYATQMALPAGWSVAFVAAEAARPGQPQQPPRLVAGIEWRGESARLAYTADRETATESALSLGSGSHEFEIRVGNDGRVAFLVDGRLRHRSAVRLLTREEHLAQLWIAGRGDPGAVVVEAIEAGAVR